METCQPPDYESQRWVVLIAVIQSLLLLVAQRSLESDGWIADTPLRLTLWYSLSLSVPTMLMLLINDIRKALPWAFGLGLFAIIGLQALNAGNSCDPSIAVECGNVMFPYVLTLTVSCFIGLAFLQVWQHHGKPSGDYNLLFEYSWHNALSLLLSAAFLGLFWLLLLLWAGLFKLLEVDFFAELFAEETFIYPISGLVIGIGVALARTRTELLANVREHSLFWIFKSLTPLLATISVLFLVAIALVGVEVLWATGHAGSLLAWLAVAIVVFINAVFLNGNHKTHYPAPIRWLVNAALLGLPVIAALGLWAISLRVEQYGWSVIRLWALYVMLVLFAYGIGYAVAVIRSGLGKGVWLNAIKPHNTMVALVIASSLAFINLGFPSFFSIAINSQMQQLHNGHVDWKDFDFKHLRFEAGIDGYKAVQDFTRSPTVELSDHGKAYLDDLLAADNRWSVELSVDSPEERRKAIHFRENEIPPKGLVEFIVNDNYWAGECTQGENRCALVSITLRRSGKPDWLFMFQGERNRDWALYNKAHQTGGDEKWEKVGELNPWGKQHSNAFDKVFAGDYKATEPAWLDLDPGSGPISVRP